MAQDTATLPARAPAPTLAEVRSEGSEVASGDRLAPLDVAAVLSAADVREIGETIGGRPHWQADVARQCGYSKSVMTRYLNGSRPLNGLLARQLQKLMVNKIESLARLLGRPGMPAAADPRTEEAQDLIARAVKLLREA